MGCAVDIILHRLKQRGSRVTAVAERLEILGDPSIDPE